MTDYQTSLAIADFITLISLFSTVGGLLYLALTSGWLPSPGSINWGSGWGRFVFSVGQGVATWVLTQAVFGVGIDDASITGLTTTAVTAGITHFTGFGSA